MPEPRSGTRISLLAERGPQRSDSELRVVGVDAPCLGVGWVLARGGTMADSEQMSPTNLFDQLASLDPQQRREVATIVRGLSETLAAVSDGKTASHVLGVLAHLLDPAERADVPE